MARKKNAEPVDVVTARKDFICTFNGHTLAFKAGQEIEEPQVANFLIDSGAPVDVPEGYETPVQIAYKEATAQAEEALAEGAARLAAELADAKAAKDSDETPTI